MDGAVRKLISQDGLQKEAVKNTTYVNSAPFNLESSKEVLLGLKSRINLFLKSEPTQVEVCLGIVSILNELAFLYSSHPNDIVRLTDAMTSLSAEVGVQNAAINLYQYSKKYLLFIINKSYQTQRNSTLEIPTSLLIEELNSIINWYENRLKSIDKTKDLKLGDEAFFNLYVIHDIQRNSNYGISVKGAIQLDCRGGGSYWLSVKVLYRGSWIAKSSEQLIMAKNEREIGRIIIDEFESFIPYSDIEWPRDLNGKVAQCIIVASVINRSEQIICSQRISELIRVSKSLDKNLSSESLVSNIQNSYSLITGNALENSRASIENNKLIIATDCIVFGRTDKNTSLSIRLLDVDKYEIFNEVYELHCLTSIAKFYDIGVVIDMNSLSDAVSYIEFVIVDELGKTLVQNVTEIL